ncbi:MAG: hypothetical protein WC073_05905 [Sterolibacterium sp.]
MDVTEVVEEFVAHEAAALFSSHGQRDFVFSSGERMYRCKVAGPKNRLRIKCICTAEVELIGIEQVGVAPDTCCHYQFRVRLPEEDRSSELILAPGQLVSLYRFKGALLGRRALFCGTKSDFEKLLLVYGNKAQALASAPNPAFEATCAKSRAGASTPR